MCPHAAGEVGIAWGKDVKRLLVSALGSLLLLSACDGPKQASAPSATSPQNTSASPTTPAVTVDASGADFQHDPKLDAFGYYFSATPVASGNWALASLNIGTPEDFAAWEQGKRPSSYAPIFLEFEDVTSPTAQNELGQTYRTVSFRLLPEVYRVDGTEVVFRARDPRVGEVVFSGAFDLNALKAAKADGPGVGDLIVLRGGLQVGAERIRNISFSYFAGD